MKTFCIIAPDGSAILMRGHSVFEVDSSSLAMQTCINIALAEKRPITIIDGSFRLTRYADRLPQTVAGKQFVKINPSKEGL